MHNFILKIRLIFFTVSVSDTGFVVSILRYIECCNIEAKYRYRPTDISILLVSIQYRGNASMCDFRSFRGFLNPLLGREKPQQIPINTCEQRARVIMRDSVADSPVTKSVKKRRVDDSMYDLGVSLSRKTSIGTATVAFCYSSLTLKLTDIFR